jgi:DNA repair photolyase
LNEVAGMPFRWSLNPYMGCAHRCTFCYVRNFEKRADRPSDDRYGTSIRVKINIAEVLRAELARASWRREGVAVGAATDPYQPAEGRYRLTRGCIKAFAAARNPFGIITRGPLIVRDIDVLAEASRRAEVTVQFSIPTLDPEVWRRTEPGAPPPRQRLRALRLLVESGINAGVAMAPILPGISDRPEQLAQVVRAAREAGSTNLWANVVYLKPGTREHFLECVAREWPEQLSRYEQVYTTSPYPNRAITDSIRDRVRELKQRHEIADRRAIRWEPPPEPEQMALAI